MAFAALIVGTMVFVGTVPAGFVLFDLTLAEALLSAALTAQGSFALVLAKALLCQAIRRSPPNEAPVAAWAYAPQLTKR